MLLIVFNLVAFGQVSVCLMVKTVFVASGVPETTLWITL